MPMISTRMQIAQSIGKSDLFRELRDGELDVLGTRAVPRRAHRGEVIFTAGQDARGLYVLVKGTARTSRQNEGGRELMLSVERPVSILGDVAAFDGRAYCTSSTALQDCDLLFIHRDDFQRICAACPSVLHKALEAMTARVRAYADLMEALSLHDVNRRVAWFLLREATRRGMSSGRRIVFELTWTHQQVACHLGTVREMVTRAFTHLQKGGLITTRGRLVTIPDQQAILRYATGARLRSVISS